MSYAHITDIRGLALTAPNAEAVERFEAIIDDTYYYRLGVQDRLDALLRECPEFVLAHVLKGYSLMTEGTLDAHPKARVRLQQSEALPANARERLHQEALRAWIAQDFPARAAAWEQILVEWPLDLLALRQYTGALFWSGDKRHQAEVIAGVAVGWRPGIPGRAHYLSAHAFAMEEVGLYAVAERSAREALEIQPQDLWALHGLSHVLEMQGRTREGIALLEDAARFLDEYNLFRGHLWWHLSLFQIARSRFDAALELFDREIYPQSSAFYLDVQNGVSLLARLEFQGVDVGPERWERLALGSLPNATQSTIWFTSMHHVIALARSGRLSACTRPSNTCSAPASNPAGPHSPMTCPGLPPRTIATIRTTPWRRCSCCVSSGAISAPAMRNRMSTTRSRSWPPCSWATCRACVSCSRRAATRASGIRRRGRSTKVTRAASTASRMQRPYAPSWAGFRASSPPAGRHP